ncbi:BTAD domain-containing putative transcriptional regulator [Actinomadura rugatobispora]|uniref:BTAD domain-containing putative transcriptional regulator n=1 Tax=Actinomadura rugatobispora TaxID=1994 RepID=A0ABW0ZR43_9ACTN|nr:BTAD domain-containing putative transcriptional regulator [Actinomadura rugatobispora]
MRFGVLGSLEVWAADGRAVRVPETKVRALLAVLLIHRGRPVPADRLIEDLWGTEPPGSPAATLRAKVSQLRRVLAGATGRPGLELVAFRSPGYLIRTVPGEVDADRFLALLRDADERAGADPRARARSLAQALDLWRGPAFADFADEEFARTEIQRLEERRLVAVEDLAETRLELGEHGTLVSELGDAVSVHPLRERLRAAYIRALYLSGRQSEALADYTGFRHLLQDELGIDPGPELVALHQAILRQDPALRTPPSRSPATARPVSNLPHPLTALIGREDAVREVRGLLASEERLVTLTGAGGVGKTRLAFEAARRSEDAFPDGVLAVELAAQPPAKAGSEGAARVAEAVAAVLGIRDDGPASRPAADERTRPLLERLVEAVRMKRMLLVLDNCEHVVGPAAELAAELLREAPDLRVLATSQEPLAVVGERLWTVQPLDLPPAEDAGDLLEGRSSAVRLFVARARAAAPGFALDASNAAAVAAICRRLDGIPLALELAATRVRAMGVHELAERLDDRFRVLTAAPRGLPARQRTLRAMIDWSWELLTEPERVVLRRLAVHAGGCTLRSAEEVCSGDGVRADEVLGLLGRLIDRSLVVPVHPPTADAAGAREVRYRLLESVAAYARERLDEAGELDRVRRRHLDHHLALAERAEPFLRGHDQRRWLEHLDAEAANLRTALETAVGTASTGAAPTPGPGPASAVGLAPGAACDAGVAPTSDVGLAPGAGDASGAGARAPEAALRLVNALAWYWFLRGRYAEARRSLQLALTAAGTAVPSADPVRAAAMAWDAGMALLVLDGSEPDPIRYSRSVLRLYDEADDPAGRARARWFVGFCRLGFGDSAAGAGFALVEEALAEHRMLGDRWGTAAALSVRAEVSLYRGETDRAQRDGEEAMALFRELGDRWGELKIVHVLGELAEITGDYERAERLRRDGLRVAEDLGLWNEASGMLARLGRVALLKGDLDQAEELHRRAWDLAAARSYLRGQEFAEVGLGMLARRRGRLDEAERHLRAWLEWCRRWEGEAGVAFTLAELGFVAELRGDAGEALALHREGLAAARSTEDRRALALAFEGLAGAWVLVDEHGRAARLLGAAHAARASVGLPLPSAERGDVDRIAAGLRLALGDAAYENDFEAGAAEPLDEVARREASN